MGPAISAGAWTHMNFTAAGLSDVGLQREHNEDSFCIVAEHRLFVVADGMGGHRAGDIASRMATTEIKAFFDATDMDDGTPWSNKGESELTPDQNRLVSAVKLANQRISRVAQRRPPAASCCGAGHSRPAVAGIQSGAEARHSRMGH